MQNFQENSAQPLTRNCRADGDETTEQMTFTEIMLFESGQELLTTDFRADIIFLDVDMPSPNGIETAKRLREEGCEAVIVFVTALREYVFDAFDVGAFHYLVKPFNEDKFREVLGKAVKLLQKREAAGKEPERVLDVRNGRLHTAVVIRDILYAEVFDREILLHIMVSSNAGNAFKDGAGVGSENVIRYYGKIGELEKTLGDGFYRIHRSFLVNMHHIRSYDMGQVNLKEHELPIARGKYQDFVKAYLRAIVDSRWQ
ncbi:MAG: LytTR family DNA-binding domain-containing protein [Lachnospiraceae bacterium]|nr:LytTR family DNA-binding domain-containing protein [Lachnospiraceae bacterium]